MGKFVQVGTAAIRSPDGEFLPAEPIYREIVERDPDLYPEYIKDDILFDLFADKCKNYIKTEQRKRLQKIYSDLKYSRDLKTETTSAKTAPEVSPEALCKDLGLDYYIKESLRAEMEAKK